MRFVEVARCSEAVGGTAARSAKVAAIAELLAGAGDEPDEDLEAAVAFLTGVLPVGRIGVGWSTIAGAVAPPAGTATLTVAEVVAALAELRDTVGAGSQAVRAGALRELTARCTAVEQRLLLAVLGGELRQGALAGVMTAGVARAAGVPVSAVQRASMLLGSLGRAAVVARRGGADALAAVPLTPFTAVQPMLAASATDVSEALDATGPAAVDWKLDGVRVQVHRVGDEVRAYTRNLRDVTDRVPAVVDLVRSLAVADVVLDGELMGMGPDGAPRPFQDAMGDLGADPAGRSLDATGGLRPFFFDVLHHDGRTVIDEPLHVRRRLLAALVPEHARVPSVVVADPGSDGGRHRAEDMAATALRTGHEGVVVKALSSVYEAGRRGGQWRKVKPVHTYDLVVLAAEWGHGRRTGWLSNLHLGARDGRGFTMVGKTFKGLTDELLRWQTEQLRAVAVAEDRHLVTVRPELVVEVAIDGVQRSTRYPGGVALRFARVRRYRPDRDPSDADTLESLCELLPDG